MVKLFSWVVTHRDSHDDEESLRRAVTDYSRSASEAWRKFIALTGKERKVWNARGYIAKRVSIKLTFDRDSHG